MLTTGLLLLELMLHGHVACYADLCNLYVLTTGLLLLELLLHGHVACYADLCNLYVSLRIQLCRMQLHMGWCAVCTC